MHLLQINAKMSHSLSQLRVNTHKMAQSDERPKSALNTFIPKIK